MANQQSATGILQINEKGFGFLRQADTNYRPSPKDVFVPRNLIQSVSLREGVQIQGLAEPSNSDRGRSQADQLTKIETTNGLSAEQYAAAPEFTKLTSVDPTERLELSAGSDNTSMRVLDLISPV